MSKGNRRLKEAVGREFYNKCLWCERKHRCGKSDAAKCRANVEEKVRWQFR